mgnify:CR=1 FL=1
MSDTQSQIRAELVRMFGDAPAAGDIRREDLAAWDSLRHVDLIFLIEEVFDIQLSEEEMARADSLSALTAIVDRHRAA